MNIMALSNPAVGGRDLERAAHKVVRPQALKTNQITRLILPRLSLRTATMSSLRLSVTMISPRGEGSLSAPIGDRSLLVVRSYLIISVSRLISLRSSSRRLISAAISSSVRGLGTSAKGPISMELDSSNGTRSSVIIFFSIIVVPLRLLESRRDFALDLRRERDVRAVGTGETDLEVSR